MKKFTYTILLVVILGCSHQKEDSIPEQFRELENLTVYSADPIPAGTVSFQKDVVYGESGEVIFGRMGEIAVNHFGRVFIADVQKMNIYVFEPDGRFAGRLGSEGSGPGEFLSYIKNLQIRGTHLYAFDPGRQKLNVFTLDTLAFDRSVSLAGNKYNYKTLEKTLPWISNIFVREDHTYIAEFAKSASEKEPQRYENVEMLSLFYVLEKSGSIKSELFEFTRELRTNLGLIINIAPFFGQVLPVVDRDNRIYLADPNHLLVKIYSQAGDYLQAFYYPFQKISLTQKSAHEAGIRDRFISDMNSMDLSENWPVTTDMLIDDKNRLWIATTVSDMSIFEWWVLENTGEIVARFEWPRDKSIEAIKNGYMYTRKRDDMFNRKPDTKTGLQQVVRYRIEFEGME